MRRVPVRWRLTLWYAALLAVVFLVFGGGLYIGLRWRLYTTFDEQLHTQAAVVLAAVQTRNGVPSLAPVATGQQEGEYLVRLVDADGRVVSGTAAMDGSVPIDPAILAAALRGETRYSLVTAERQALRVVTLPVRQGENGPVVGALQVGLDRQDTDDALDQLLVALGLATPLMLLVAVFGGYLLGGRALAPVVQIADLASRIGERDLHARLNLDLPDDELGYLARTFNGMLARIEDAFERQRRFTGDAAHELRTPLSLMRSQIDLALARPRPAEECWAALQGLDEDLERLTGLVSSLLTLARADTEQLVLDRVAFDLSDLVDVVLEQYEPVAQAAGVTLTGETAPTPLVADQDLLVQVLVNLLDNALAHTPAGGRMAIGCRVVGDQASLWVTDTGSGIPPEHVERVFERFYRVDFGRARVHGGAGLGLNISRAIVEAHGGTISLESAVGSGTRVNVRLPAGQERAARL